MRLFCAAALRVTCLLCFAAACSQTPSGGDAALDGDAAADGDGMDAVVPTCTRTFEIARGSPVGHATPLAVGAGQARAGRLTAAQLPTDRTGLLLGAAGDFVLANERFAVVIEDVGPSDLYQPWGGGLMGIARVRDGRLVDATDFGEAIQGVGRFTLRTESVTVMEDGSSGGPAVLRASGPLAAIPFIDVLGRSLAPAPFGDVALALDYELAPGRDYLDLWATYFVSRARVVSVAVPLHGFFQSSRLPMFTRERGFAGPMGTVPSEWVGFVDDAAMSYAWQAPDSMLTPFLSISGFDSFISTAFDLPACEQTRRHLARVHIGGPGADGLLVAMARTANQMLREVRITVTETNGAPATDARVHVTSTDGNRYFTRSWVDAMGTATVHVPVGQAVRIVGVRAGEDLAAPVDVGATEGTASVRMPARGAIHVVATDDRRMLPLPSRVQLYPIGRDPPAAPLAFGEPAPGRGRSHVEFPTTGDITLPVTPGRFRVVVSHGFQFEIHDQEVTVAAGATVEVRANLHRVVDAPGVLCADFHVHTHRSPDAQDPARLKLAAIAGDGLDIAVRSDHEFVADFAPLVRDMGLEPWTYPVPSLELTTFAWGHFGVVPFVPQPNLPNAGALDWVGRMPPDVFAEARRRPESPTIIINHPRTGGAFGGYFEAAGFDPATGRARNAAMWDNDFSAVEVFNNSDFEGNRRGTVADWFSLLNHGRRVFSVGSSDSHEMLPSNPVGYPRTCMFLGTDDPRMLTANAVRDAAARGRGVVSGGVLVTAQAPGGAGPGLEEMGVGPMARVRVLVQAPTWVPAARLEVIVDGVTVETRPLGPATVDPMNPVVRFRGDIGVPVAASGSWVVFVVHGGGDLAPVLPGKSAFGVTNPIFLRR